MIVGGIHLRYQAQLVTEHVEERRPVFPWWWRFVLGFFWLTSTLLPNAWDSSQRHRISNVWLEALAFRMTLADGEIDTRHDE